MMSPEVTFIICLILDSLLCAQRNKEHERKITTENFSDLLRPDTKSTIVHYSNAIKESSTEKISLFMNSGVHGTHTPARAFVEVAEHTKRHLLFAGFNVARSLLEPLSRYAKIQITFSNRFFPLSMFILIGYSCFF